MKIIGCIPSDAHIIIFQRESEAYPDRYRASILPKKDLNERLCGVRGDFIITLDRLEDKEIMEVALPLLVAGLMKKRSDGKYRLEPRPPFRNDYAEPDYSI
jgi:hypothetical protein